MWHYDFFNLTILPKQLSFLKNGETVLYSWELI